MNKRIKLFLTFAAIIIFVQPACKREIPAPKATTLACNDISYETSLADKFTDPGVVDYIVSCDILITSTFTIQPGVVIEFAPGAGFTIDGYGSLKAEGTAANPIVFKGATDAPGSWKGIWFGYNNTSYDSKLAYVNISGGGSESFTTENILANIKVEKTARVSIDHCTIEKSLGDGVYINGSSIDGVNPITSFSGNSINNNTNYPLSLDPAILNIMDVTTTFSGNGKQFVCLRGATISYDQQWNALQVPYLVNGDMVISSSFNYASVTVAAGTKLVFASESGIKVSGMYCYLKMNGSSSQHITLTGEAEIAGAWKGINYQSTNTGNVISYADISYGGCCTFTTSSTDVGNIVVGGNSSGKVTVSYTTINNSEACGVKVKTNGTFTATPLSSVTYSNNVLGTVCN